ncbi:hypothetical protein GCM10009789_76070 [Kribbella sancticallisti]|uniref:DUF4184 family protein n=1 Tax=Kribbella sancticallisti TaxID=460087 RepID=A0ABN2EQC9_9ACTN
MAPDLLYVGPLYRFATMHIHGNLTLTLTHKFSSAFWLDPLLALLALLVFHLVLRRPLVALAPAALAARLPLPPRGFSPVRVFWIVVSVVIGGFTHVLWDSFTHYDGYFVRHNWDFFTANITSYWDVNRVLQYLSSIGGILAIAVWLYFWWRRTNPGQIEPERYVPASARYAVLAAAGLAGVAAAVLEVARAEGPLLGEAVFRLILTGLAMGGLIVLGCYVVIWHLLLLRGLRGGRVSAL